MARHEGVMVRRASRAWQLRTSRAVPAPARTTCPRLQRPGQRRGPAPPPHPMPAGHRTSPVLVVGGQDAGSVAPPVGDAPPAGRTPARESARHSGAPLLHRHRQLGVRELPRALPALAPALKRARAGFDLHTPGRRPAAGPPSCLLAHSRVLTACLAIARPTTPCLVDFPEELVLGHMQRRSHALAQLGARGALPGRDQRQVTWPYAAQRRKFLALELRCLHLVPECVSVDDVSVISIHG